MGWLRLSNLLKTPDLAGSVFVRRFGKRSPTAKLHAGLPSSLQAAGTVDTIDEHEHGQGYRGEADIGGKGHNKF